MLRNSFAFALTTTCLFCFALLTAASAKADIITTHSDRALFNTATGDPSPTIETFEGGGSIQTVNGSPFFNSSTAGFSFIELGATYSTTEGNSPFDFGIDGNGNFSTPGGQQVLSGFSNALDANRALTITFDSPQQAFAFDTNKSMGTDFDMTITFSSGPDYTANFSTVQPDFSTLMFFGWQSASADITSVIIDGNGNLQDGLGGGDQSNFAFLLDNATFTAVPEPSAVAFWLLASCATVFVARKKK